MIAARQLIQSLVNVRRDRELRSAFRAVFFDSEGNMPPAQRTVIGYLRTVCGADVSSLMKGRDGVIDPLATAAAEGARAVWLKSIYLYLNLDDGELVEIDRGFTQKMRDLVEQQEIYRE